MLFTRKDEDFMGYVSFWEGIYTQMCKNYDIDPSKFP